MSVPPVTICNQLMSMSEISAAPRLGGDFKLSCSNGCGFGCNVMINDHMGCESSDHEDDEPTSPLSVCSQDGCAALVCEACAESNSRVCEKCITPFQNICSDCLFWKCNEHCEKCDIVLCRSCSDYCECCDKSMCKEVHGIRWLEKPFSDAPRANIYSYCRYCISRLGFEGRFSLGPL